ncbi:MAG TPA: ECF transporter S component [Oscillospiraceae bacterium]|nr:ECF transporter S component [Oscillospiraceae bacterium]
MKKQNIQKLAFSGMFLALALVLPFLTGQVPQIGKMLAPMHLPVLLCGFICGWPYGLVVGFVAPPLRYLLFQMPPILPTGVPMAFELAIYGLVAGILFKILPKKNTFIYLELLISMILGRIVWGIAMLTVMNMAGNPFGLKAFWAGAVVNALPGIILQLILIPIIVIFLQKSKLLVND